MNKIFNIILIALFCTSFVQAQKGKTFEFTYEGQTLKYEVANGNEATVSKQKSEKNSGDVKIPENVTFAGKKYSVTTIGELAFSDCTGLTSITIPNSVTSIGEFAFSGCSGLTSVTIPTSVTSIGWHAFSGCSGLTSVTIPNSVTTIRDGTFWGCSGLSSITIPNSVTTIGELAFSDCTGLTSVTIPTSVTEIGAGGFACGFLKSINVSKDNSRYCTQNGVLFDITKKTLIQCPSGITGKYAIPNGVTTIEEFAFYKCSGLTSVTIPNSVTTIKTLAFSGCTGLTSVNIPTSVTEIWTGAFECGFLKSINVSKFNSHYCSENGVLFYITKKTLIQCPGGITGKYAIPTSVTSIGFKAFSGCTGLTSVTIPNSVTTIEDYAFSGCTGLSILTIENATPPNLEGGYTFVNVSEKITLYVPAESVEKYKTANGWRKYADKIKAMPAK